MTINRRDGEPRVSVLPNEPPAVEAGFAETPVRWENGVLFYAGEVLGPIEHAVEDSREERIRHLLGGCQPATDHGQQTTDHGPLEGNAMTTVAILPVATSAGRVEYQAVSGPHRAAGKSAGQALDALAAEDPELESEGLVIVQRFRADPFFPAEQQHRLQTLMERWRQARDRGQTLSEDEQAELNSLVVAEFDATARRAAAIAPRPTDN